MPPIANFLLLILQWLLMLLGVHLIVSVLRKYYLLQQYLSSQPAGPNIDIGLGQTLMVGLAMGLCPIGIGAILFYLRRIYRSRC